jgi:hypothetical protein
LARHHLLVVAGTNSRDHRHIYNIDLVDDTVGPLLRINDIQCSSCTQLHISNQIQDPTTSNVIPHKRSDRSRQSNYFDLIKQNGKEM